MAIKERKRISCFNVKGNNKNREVSFVTILLGVFVLYLAVYMAISPLFVSRLLFSQAYSEPLLLFSMAWKSYFRRLIPAMF